jgi:hypothetical protein
MVVRYNIPYHTPSVVTKRSYKRRSKGKYLVSPKENVTKVTSENKLFLKSLGFEVLI